MKDSKHFPKRLLLGALVALQSLMSAHAEMNLGVVQPSTIGHAFFDPNISPPYIMPRSVVDFLIDQNQSSGGGGLLSGVSANWDTNTQFSLTVSAPPGHKFSVQVPPGRAVGFGGFLWWESTRGGFSPPGTVAVSFTGLEGTAPVFDQSTSVLSDSHGFFGFMDLEGTRVSNSFAFTSIRLTATVTPQLTGNGFEDYVPHLESSMQLYYTTPETNDPGRFVFIVPVGTNTPPSNAAPVVNWILPTNGSVFTAGSPITLRANAMDADGTIAFVDFYDGFTSVGRVFGSLTNGSYHLVWTNASPGTHQLRVKATDNVGATSSVPLVQVFVNGITNPPPTNVLPVVSWVRPTNGSVVGVGTPITLTANATDADGTVSYVEFFAGAVNLGQGVKVPTNSQYNLVWSNAPLGMHQMRAEAVDNAGGRSVSAFVEVSVTAITNPPPGNAAPVVTWLQPTNGAVFAQGSSVLLRASASDSDGTLTNIDFVAGSNLVRRISGTLTNGIYNVTWSNAPVGTHLLRALARDNAGALGTSAPVQITVTGTNINPNNLAPLISWVHPTNGASLPGGPILLTAHATDPDGTATYVDFYATPTNQPSVTAYLGRIPGPRTNGLYSLTWSNASAGSFHLQAVAGDNLGSRGYSEIIEVVVGAGTNVPPNNLAPVISWVRPTNGASFPLGPILLTAQATDPDGTVSYVDFYATPDVQPSVTTYLGRVFGPRTNNLYSLSWSNAPTGNFHLQAVAGDNLGLRGYSAVVLIAVGEDPVPPNNLAPVVSWFRPTNGTVFAFGAPILLRANASDSDGTLSIVDFLLGTNLLGRVSATTNGVYNFSWSNAPVGIHRLHAEAVDNLGARGVSTPVNIVVNGPGGPNVVDLGTVEVQTLGQNSGLSFLIDQDHNSGGGGVLPNVSVNWDTNYQFKLTVTAPPNMKFSVAVPPGQTARFGGHLFWQSSGNGGSSPPGPVTATFTGLEGSAPAFGSSDAVLSDTHGFFGFYDLETTSVSNSFAFTSVTLHGTVMPQYTGDGTRNFAPHLESIFYIWSPGATNASGSLVSLVPIPPPPQIRVMATSSQTGVHLSIYGQAGRTHIVECSPDTITWIPINTAVMPALGTMQVQDASAAAVSSRFYRVVEVP